MQEVWKDIKKFEGVYQVSNLGNIRRLDTIIPFSGTLSLRKGKVLKNTMNSKGYLTIVLCFKGLRKTYSVHMLVAEAFIIKLPGREQVNHIDGNKLNNQEDNLEWCTPSQNQHHAYRLGLKGQGEKAGLAVLTEKEVLEIKKELNQTRLLSDNKTYKIIAKKYNVTRTAIKWIDKGKTWKSVVLHDG